MIGNLHLDSVDWHVGDSPVLLDLGSNATVTDVDSPSLPDFELPVSSGYTGDVIGIADIGGVTHDSTDVYVDLVDIGDILIDGVTGTLHILLSGQATTEYVERLLRAVTITNTDPTPQLGAHLIQISLYDPVSFTSAQATATFNVLAPNLSVGDRVFFDADDSGGYSAGDTGLDGITIDLVAGNGTRGRDHGHRRRRALQLHRPRRGRLLSVAAHRRSARRLCQHPVLVARSRRRYRRRQ